MLERWARVDVSWMKRSPVRPPTITKCSQFDVQSQSQTVLGVEISWMNRSPVKTPNITECSQSQISNVQSLHCKIRTQVAAIIQPHSSPNVFPKASQHWPAPFLQVLAKSAQGFCRSGQNQLRVGERHPLNWQCPSLLLSSTPNNFQLQLTILRAEQHPRRQSLSRLVVSSFIDIVHQCYLPPKLFADGLFSIFHTKDTAFPFMTSHSLVN